MSVTTVGYMLTIDNQPHVVVNKPSHKVVKFITDDEFKKMSNNIMSKYVVREMLTCTNGQKIVVNYIKSHK